MHRRTLPLVIGYFQMWLITYCVSQVVGQDLFIASYCVFAWRNDPPGWLEVTIVVLTTPLLLLRTSNTWVAGSHILATPLWEIPQPL